MVGCDSANRKIELNEELDNLRIQNRQLRDRLEQKEDQISRLKKQTKTVSGIYTDYTIEEIYNLHNVEIGKYTNLYDKDKDGTREKLIVYLQPTDINGDVIKAPGKVQIQLWDLQKPSEQAKLKEWNTPAEELAKNWFSSLMLAGYRLKFDASEIIQEFDYPLTVKLEFTDYITGKTFNKQKVIYSEK
jgi:hypothetical protein